MLRTLLYAGLILAVAGGVLTWWLRRAETAAAAPESTPTPSASATMDPAVGTCASGSYAAYVNASKRYRLSYCSLWKVESRGSLTVFTSGATQATDRYQKHGTGDVMLSLADYLADTVKSLDVQVRDLANQFSATGVAEPLTIGTLRGYSAGMGSGVYQSYTVVIQGRYQMYILQFPLVGNRAALWEAQEKLLVSFEEV